MEDIAFVDHSSDFLLNMFKKFHDIYERAALISKLSTSTDSETEAWDPSMTSTEYAEATVVYQELILTYMAKIPEVLRILDIRLHVLNDISLSDFEKSTDTEQFNEYRKYWLKTNNARKKQNKRLKYAARLKLVYPLLSNVTELLKHSTVTPDENHPMQELKDTLLEMDDALNEIYSGIAQKHEDWMLPDIEFMLTNFSTYESDIKDVMERHMPSGTGEQVDYKTLMDALDDKFRTCA